MSKNIFENYFETFANIFESINFHFFSKKKITNFPKKTFFENPFEESRLDKRCADWTMPGRERRTTDEEGVNQIDTIIPSPQPRNSSRGPNQMITRVTYF